MKKPGLDYAAAGVDYGTLDASKILAQKAARATAVNLARHGAAEIEASRGESAYLVEVGGVLIASITECLGTKALVADAVRSFSGRSHYDTIAQDTIAMAVNDLVTVGATPLSSHAYWSAGSSEWFADQERMQDLVRGWQGACDVCGMSWGGGETPALGGVVEAARIDLAASCVGIVKGRDRLMLGERLAPGDAIVLLASSGIHANGISLARKLAERLPDGYRATLADGRTFGEALLDPTVLYAPITEQRIRGRRAPALRRQRHRPRLAQADASSGRAALRHPQRAARAARARVPASAGRHERARRVRHVQHGRRLRAIRRTRRRCGDARRRRARRARRVARRRRRSRRQERRHRAARLGVHGGDLHLRA